MIADPSPTAVPAAPPGLRRVALVGNPNVGKTSVFNALTGFRARVGNYAGVTVERRAGPLKLAPGATAVEIIDLPGTYSLNARSADEMIATDLLLGRLAGEARPDAVLIVVDATNLERNLFFATQVLELGLPSAIVLNMIDCARSAGQLPAAELLARRLGVPVLPTDARNGEGLEAVARAAREGGLPAGRPLVEYPAALEAEAQALAAIVAANSPGDADGAAYLCRRALLEVDGAAEAQFAAVVGEPFVAALAEARARLAAGGLRLATLEAKLRYGVVRPLVEGVVPRAKSGVRTFSDRLDRVLVHPVWGLMIFAALLLVVFQSIYSWSGPLMDGIDGAFGLLGDLAMSVLPEGPLASFLVDGALAGVGGVLVFLPQILILFFFIGLLEDCGYMARAAFLMDRLLSRCGLSGRSFIPLLSSFACAIPGIMATRTIEDRRDRLATILVAPLMSCSARLPVYTLFIGAFVPARDVIPGVIGLQATTMLAMYAVGVATAAGVAALLRVTWLKGRSSSFVMELPPYKRPQFRTLFHRMYERGKDFVVQAGTLILAVSVLVWAAAYYPRREAVAAEVDARFAPAVMVVEASKPAPGADPVVVAAWEESLTAVEAERDVAREGAWLRDSVLGRAGQAIEPVVLPLGWDWRVAMAVIASFPAREVIVGTLGVLYDSGTDVDETSVDLRDKIKAARWPDGSPRAGQPVFNLPVALSIMVFFALCAQCAATLAVIRRETGSGGWALFTFAYMTALAYVGALIVYHGAMLLGLGGIGT